MHKVLLVLLFLTCALGCAIWAADAPPAKDTPELPKTKINPKDGAEMVLIPAGEFLMGTSEDEITSWLKAYPDDKHHGFTDELPQRKVDLDAFYMYKNDVTVAQYRKFCAATKRDMPPEPSWKWQKTHPIVNVTWDDAKAYADWAGTTLPTEAQWEKAARGDDGRPFPWGFTWDATKCNNAVSDNDYRNYLGKTSPVGSFPAGASPYGCLDMAGNVLQWCADWYDEGYYQKAPTRNPTGPAIGTGRVLRGGNWTDFTPRRFRAAVRNYHSPLFRSYSILGFRCAVCSPGP